jgi:ATP-binding cassette subfamily C protein CydC
VLLATHRLSALAAADEVIVLGRDHDLGPARVLARGDHSSLLTSHPAYRWAVDREHEESA